MIDKTEYRRGYCKAYATSAYVVVNHSKFDTPADIALAARECNYRAGNWNRSQLVNAGSANKSNGRMVTFFEIVRGI